MISYRKGLNISNIKFTRICIYQWSGSNGEIGRTTISEMEYDGISLLLYLICRTK